MCNYSKFFESIKSRDVSYNDAINTLYGYLKCASDMGLISRLEYMKLLDEAINYYFNA